MRQGRLGVYVCNHKAESFVATQPQHSQEANEIIIAPGRAAGHTDLKRSIHTATHVFRFRRVFGNLIKFLTGNGSQSTAIPEEAYAFI